MNFRHMICLSAFLLFQACVPKAALDHDNAELDRLLNEHHAQVESCYKNARAANPKVSGSLIVRADNNPDGSLSMISLHKGFPGSQNLFECIKNEMTSWKTDRPQTRGSLEMTWTFN